MKISKLKILYDGVLLELVELPREYSMAELIEVLGKYIKSMTIGIENLENNPIYQINVKEHWIIEHICNLLNVKLNLSSTKILRYLFVIDSLCFNNFGIVDDHIIKNNVPLLVKYTEMIAERNYVISRHLLINYFNEENLLLCYL